MYWHSIKKECVKSCPPKPCVFVDCQEGWINKGQDKQGCGGICIHDCSTRDPISEWKPEKKEYCCKDEEIPDEYCGSFCQYGDEMLIEQAVITSRDGCKSCKCQGGSVVCTMRPDCFCTYNNKKFPPGATFDAKDDAKDECNKCTCSVDGLSVECTKGRLCEVCDAPNGKRKRVGEVWKHDRCTECSCLQGGQLDCIPLPCPPEPVQCTYQGTTHEAGSVFRADDGCNKCTCLDDGTVKCTDTECKCKYGDQYYLVEGDDWTADDGYNICECRPSRINMDTDMITASVDIYSLEMESPKVVCTTARCPNCCKHNNQLHLDGAAFKEDCNECKCDGETGTVTCTKKECSQGCIWDGRKYEEGDKFEHGNGCGRCQCIRGVTVCDDRPCVGTCKLKDGTEIRSGSKVPHPDGCGTCICTDGGVISCPKVFDVAECSQCNYKGIQYQIGEHFSDDCNKCECTADGIACESLECSGFCEYDGRNVKIGDSFTEGCVTYICIGNNNLQSSDLGCENEDTCIYNGKEHDLLTEFTDSTGCKKCFCSSRDSVLCQENVDAQGKNCGTRQELILDPVSTGKDSVTVSDSVTTTLAPNDRKSTFVVSDSYAIRQFITLSSVLTFFCALLITA
jgi:hypothetical protein